MVSLIPMHESLRTRHMVSLISMHESLEMRCVASLETDECSEGMWFGLLISFSWHQQFSQNCVYISHSSTLAILECAVVMEDTSVHHGSPGNSKCGETLALFQATAAFIVYST